MKTSTLVKHRNALLVEFNRLKSKIDQLESLIEFQVGNDNKEYLKVGDQFVAVAVTTHIRDSWVTDKLEKLLGTKAERYKRHTPYKVLRIRAIKREQFMKATKGT